MVINTPVIINIRNILAKIQAFDCHKSITLIELIAIDTSCFEWFCDTYYSKQQLIFIISLTRKV